MKENEDKFIGVKLIFTLIAIIVLFLFGLVNTCSSPNHKNNSDYNEVDMIPFPNS